MKRLTSEHLTSLWNGVGRLIFLYISTNSSTASKPLLKIKRIFLYLDWPDYRCSGPRPIDQSLRSSSDTIDAQQTPGLILFEIGLAFPKLLFSLVLGNHLWVSILQGLKMVNSIPRDGQLLVGLF